jgi:hypothetical protein
MSSGELRLEYTLAGFVVAGYSHLELFFREEGQKRLSIMSALESPSAFRCAACATVVLCGEHGTDTECMECGAARAPGVTSCTKCGWTYSRKVS